LLLLVASLDGRYTGEPPGTVVLREVELYEPPPPPPPEPPAGRNGAGSAGPPMALANRENQIQLRVMELDAELPAGQGGNFGTGFGGLGDGTGFGGLGIFSLSELDEVPMVMSAPALVYPEEAIERGIDEFQVRIHVVIDEEGRTYPVGIVENPFPSLQREFEDYTSKVRFSPPRRLGLPVRTEYLWPLLIKRP
jgi:hypothetical protein